MNCERVIAIGAYCGRSHLPGLGVSFRNDHRAIAAGRERGGALLGLVALEKGAHLYTIDRARIDGCRDNVDIGVVRGEPPAQTCRTSGVRVCADLNEVALAEGGTAGRRLENIYADSSCTLTDHSQCARGAV